MTRLALAAIFALGLVACSAGITAPPAYPLPAHLLRQPAPPDPAAWLSPRTHRRAELGEVRPIDVGHCGLFSPIDFDGSLWNPIAGRDADGRPLQDDIPEGPGRIGLVDPNTAVLTAGNGAVVVLSRHEGERAYFLCM